MAQEFTIEVAVALEAMSEGKCPVQQKKLDEQMRHLATVEQRFRDQIVCLEQVQAQATSGDADHDTDWEQVLADAHDKLAQDPEHKRTVDEFVEEKTKALKRKVWDVHHAGNESDEGDEDLAIVSEKVSLMCPISRVLLVRPMKNQPCGHYYSEEAINNYLKRRKKELACPVSACSKKVSHQTIEFDVEMERALIKHQRQQVKDESQTTPGDDAAEDLTQHSQ